MLKRNVPVIIIVIFLLALAPGPLKAGTIMLGAKAWFAVWGSEFGNTLAEIGDRELASEYSYFYYGTYDDAIASSKAETAKGILAGPLVSYQTDDRLWTISLAFMWFSSFSQDMKGNLYDIPDDENYPYEWDLELTRKEIDFAVARSLTENWRVYVGYKQQSLENKFTLNEPSSDPFKFFDIKTDINIPTVGMIYSTPLSESIALGIQLGVLYVMPDLEYKDYFFDESGSLDMKNTLGFNGEVMLTWLVSESVALQGGYRYQYMKLEFDDPLEEVGFEIDPIRDTFHGVTVTAVYMMSVGS